MEDLQIIDLYIKRDETAITETSNKYGAFCRSVAKNILTLEEDTEECVNDAYLHAWNSIPPQRPASLGAWLGRVVRNISLDLWRKNHRQKRYSGIEEIFYELSDCVPSPQTVEKEIEGKDLSGVINSWLASLPKDDRVLFVRRYWYGDTVNELAKELGMTAGSLAKRMYRLRIDLKSALEKEGYLL